MKKILCFILALTMIFSLAACAKSGGQEETSGTPQEETGAEPETVREETAGETEAVQEETVGETEAVQEETAAETETVQEETAAEPASETEAPQTQAAVEAGSDDTQPEAAALIVYFSWSGNTESVANEIQAQTGADIFKIVPETPYTDDYETLLDIAQEEQAADVRPAIRDTVENFDQYDVVYLGYPNWWGDMPMILYTFLDEYDFSGKTIAPFVTSGGSGFSNTLSTIESLEPEAAVTEGLSLGSSAAAQPESEVAEWLEAIGLEDAQGNASPLASSGNEDMQEENTDALVNVNRKEGEQAMVIQVGDRALTAVLENNSSARALMELLAEGPLTIEMEDYANMEKVGSIGTSLPRNDEPITTEAGDLILYQGNSFVIYYAPNSWNFTRLGHIEDVDGSGLLEILGEGDVTVTLSLG